MPQFKDVFICYSCTDSDSVVEKVWEFLRQAGLTVWGDDEADTSGDFSLQQGITYSHSVLMLLSPEALADAVCCRTVEIACQYNKRLIWVDWGESVGLDRWRQSLLYQTAAAYTGDLDQTPHTGQGEALLRTVLARLESQADYVQYHTHYLVQALEWHEARRPATLLLTGEATRQAERWLTQRVWEDQLSCLPTDLHCEFITESLKQANGGMTQVCLSYAEADAKVAAQVRQSLMRAGLTVWSWEADVLAATDFEESCLKAIEQADNFVFLLSPPAVASAQCRQSLAHAEGYHKRIIPLRVEPVAEAMLPPSLKELAYIDLSDNMVLADYRQDENALLKTLKDQAPYYEWHKRILVKALIWEQQNCPQAMLLQGGEFAIAQQWLQQGTPDPAHRPTHLHREFIETSEEINQFYDAFISYGRADSKAFAAELYHRLSDLGLRIWFDQNDIPLGVDYQRQIDEGIARSHNFIFIISPHSVNSPYCHLEIEQALQFKKRIIPLMHVEEISYTVWEGRNLGGTPEQWQAYRSAGKHSAYVNMNRQINKINWVFCREGIDNFEASFQGLLEIFKRDQDYVRQHTYLLTRALMWERQQRQAAALLMGPVRIEATTWLRRRFTDRQPPCLPVALHAEYICESLKYADQGMTQVFLSYAEENREHQENIRLNLMLEGITVWSNKTDIESGQDFQVEINRGIENADSLVILLSPQSLQSTYCLREVRYAFELNKRIIPLLIFPVDLPTAEQLSVPITPLAEQTDDSKLILSRLYQLQFLDFTAPLESQPYRQSLDKLLKRLWENAQYFREHKELLVQALKWERQQKNPSILLRGNLLRYYDAWGKVAAQRSNQPPTPLQQQFLAESLQQPVDVNLDVYLTCAPEDLEFARKLNDTLQIQGKTTWFPTESVKHEFNLQEDAQRGLEQAQNAVFVLSPNWINSEECQAELIHALRLNKRIIPVLHRSVISSKLPEALRKLHWVDFQKGKKDFLSSFGELYRLLESEPEHVRSHTQLLLRTKVWEEANCDDSYLLRGRELRTAEAWLRQVGGKTPQPTAAQRQYIEASRQLPRRRLKPRSLLGSAVAFTTLVCVARLLGLLQPLELRAYDWVLSLRPSEPPDNRFLLVTVDQNSGDWLRQQMRLKRYQPSIGTIPDLALTNALQIISNHNPALIGLDFYRDFEAAPTLASRIRNTPNLIALCKASYAGRGVQKPPEVPIDQVGFNDFVHDGEQFVRRHYLKQDADPKFCNTTEAFSLKLVRTYLEQRGIRYTDPWEGKTVQNMRVGVVPVPQLFASQTAGYSPVHQAALKGYQTMINFRSTQGSALKFAETVPLEDLLMGQVSRQQIEGRIVLIGYTDSTDRNADHYNTPYGEMPGVVLQGQMASQLISAALNRRPLIWWWPLEVDSLWVLGWSLLGGWIVWRFVKPRSQIIVSGIALVFLGGLCYLVMVAWAGWIPLVPPLLGGLGTGATVAYLSYRIRHP